jgi:entericidin B
LSLAVQILQRKLFALVSFSEQLCKTLLVSVQWLAFVISLESVASEMLVSGEGGAIMKVQTLQKTFLALLMACSLVGIFGSIGCNTVHGLGQDIERGGEKTQDAADAVKRRM